MATQEQATSAFNALVDKIESNLQELDTNKADSIHTHAYSEITGKPTDLVHNTATGEDSLTLLGYATSEDNSINIGKNSCANGTCSVAIGQASKVLIDSEVNGATSEGAIAIGFGSEVQDDCTIAIGRGAKAKDTCSTAIGCQSKAFSSSSVAIGYQAETNNNALFAIGGIVKATAINAMQLGNGTNNEGDTLYVGFAPSRNYKMLDYYGKIPDDRLNNTIARTSQLFSGSYNDLTNKPTLFSGSYNDLTNKPTIPDAQIQADWAQTTTTAKDYIKNKPTLFSGSYNDLTNKPTIPTVPNIATSVSSSSTNSETVGAKLFYDTIGNIEALLQAV